MKSLLLFRHAKSDWDNLELKDFDRPLNQRGNKAAMRMGHWMNENHIQPRSTVVEQGEADGHRYFGAGASAPIPA